MHIFTTSTSSILRPCIAQLRNSIAPAISSGYAFLFI
jgi:hypothetical protein